MFHVSSIDKSPASAILDEKKGGQESILAVDNFEFSFGRIIDGQRF